MIAITASSSISVNAFGRPGLRVGGLCMGISSVRRLPECGTVGTGPSGQDRRGFPRASTQYGRLGKAGTGKSPVPALAGQKTIGARGHAAGRRTGILDATSRQG